MPAETQAELRLVCPVKTLDFLSDKKDQIWQMLSRILGSEKLGFITK